MLRLSWLLTSLVLGVLLLSCSSTPVTSGGIGSVPVVESEGSIGVGLSEPEPQVPVPASGDIPASGPGGTTWISPSKVYLGGFYAGAEADYFLWIHNGSLTPVTFSVTPKEPGWKDGTYINMPLGWVTVASPIVSVGPGVTEKVSVIVKAPGAFIPKVKKYSFWIGVMDTGQVGMIKTEVCSKWFVDFK